jgi:hypothetical protein
MAGVRGRRPRVRSRAHVEPIDASTRTLAEHYRHRLERRVRHRRGVADEMLLRVFTPHPARRTALRASAMLRASKSRLVPALVRELGVDRYSVYQIIRMAIERSDKLGLYVRGNRRDAVRHARWVLARMLRLYSQTESPQLTL